MDNYLYSISYDPREDSSRVLREAAFDLEALRTQAEDAIGRDDQIDIVAAWNIALRRFRDACKYYATAYAIPEVSVK